MDLAVANIFPVIDTWPLRRNFQQKYDAMGRQIWTDRLTHALLTGALIFPLHSAPGRGMKSGRNEIIALYLYQQTGIYRTPRQCGSKLQHLFTCDEIKAAVENYRPFPDPAKREELLNQLMPLIPSLRAVQDDRPPSPPPRRGKPYSGPKADHVNISLDGASASFSLLGYTARTDPAAIISGATALELTDLAPRTPVLKAHVDLPPNLNVDKWSGIQIELVVPGANSVEYYTIPRIGDLRGQDLLVKTTPTAGAKFFAPVGPGSLPDILRTWNTEECRRRLVPDVSIVQRFRARRKGGKMSRDEFLVVVYSLEVAEKESDVSVSIRPAIVIPPVTAATDLPFSINLGGLQDAPPLQAIIKFPPKPLTVFSSLALPAPSRSPALDLAASPDTEGYGEPPIPYSAGSSYSDISPATCNFSPSSTLGALYSPCTPEDYGLPPSPVSVAKVAITAPKPRPPNPFDHVQWLVPDSSHHSIELEPVNGDQTHQVHPAQVQVVEGRSCDDTARPPFDANDFTLNATTGLDFSAAAASSSSSPFSTRAEYQPIAPQPAEVQLIPDQVYASLGNPVEYYLNASSQQSLYISPSFGIDGEVTTMIPSTEFIAL